MPKNTYNEDGQSYYTSGNSYVDNAMKTIYSFVDGTSTSSATTKKKKVVESEKKETAEEKAKREAKKKVLQNSRGDNRENPFDKRTPRNDGKGLISSDGGNFLGFASGLGGGIRGILGSIGEGMNRDRTAENNYGYIGNTAKNIIMGAGLSAISPLLGLAVMGGRMANNIAAVNAARESMGLPAMSKEEEKAYSQNESNGFVGYFTVDGVATYRVGLDSYNLTTITPDRLSKIVAENKSTIRPATKEEIEQARKDPTKSHYTVLQVDPALKDRQNKVVSTTEQEDAATEKPATSYNPYNNPTMTDSLNTPSSYTSPTAVEDVVNKETFNTDTSGLTTNLRDDLGTLDTSQYASTTSKPVFAGTDPRSAGWRGSGARASGTLQSYASAMSMYEAVTGKQAPSIIDAIGKTTSGRLNPNSKDYNPNSNHFSGTALDISTEGMTNTEKQALIGSLYQAGFRGFGLGANSIHADKRARGGLWGYRTTSLGGSKSKVNPKATWAGISMKDWEDSIQYNNTLPQGVIDTLNSLRNPGIATPTFREDYLAAEEAAKAVKNYTSNPTIDNMNRPAEYSGMNQNQNTTRSINPNSRYSPQWGPYDQMAEGRVNPHYEKQFAESDLRDYNNRSIAPTTAPTAAQTRGYQDYGLGRESRYMEDQRASSPAQRAETQRAMEEYDAGIRRENTVTPNDQYWGYNQMAEGRVSPYYEQGFAQSDMAKQAQQERDRNLIDGPSSRTQSSSTMGGNSYDFNRAYDYIDYQNQRAREGRAQNSSSSTAIQGTTTSGSTFYGAPSSWSYQGSEQRSIPDDLGYTSKSTISSTDESSGKWNRDMGTGQDFYDNVYDTARSLGANHVQASLAATQATQETGAGTSSLMMGNNNLFGIKATKESQKSFFAGTRENYNDRIKASFRAYDTTQESVANYLANMSANYSKAWNAATVEEAIQGTMSNNKGLAYATDKNAAGRNVYADRLQGVYDKYGANKNPASWSAVTGTPNTLGGIRMNPYAAVDGRVNESKYTDQYGNRVGVPEQSPGFGYNKTPTFRDDYSPYSTTSGTIQGTAQVTTSQGATSENSVDIGKLIKDAYISALTTQPTTASTTRSVATTKDDEEDSNKNTLGKASVSELGVGYSPFSGYNSDKFGSYNYNNPNYNAQGYPTTGSTRSATSNNRASDSNNGMFSFGGFHSSSTSSGDSGSSSAGVSASSTNGNEGFLSSIGLSGNSSSSVGASGTSTGFARASSSGTGTATGSASNTANIGGINASGTSSSSSGVSGTGFASNSGQYSNYSGGEDYDH